MTLGWALLVIALVYFSVISPGFRKFAASAAVLLVVGGIIVVVLLRQKAEQRQAEQTTAQERAEQERENYLAQLPKDEDVIYQTKFRPAGFNTWKGHSFTLVRSSNMLADLERENRFHESWASDQHVRFHCKPSTSCQVTNLAVHQSLPFYLTDDTAGGPE